MNNIDHLKKALEATLSQLSQKKTESSNGKLISSWNDEYNYGGINIFETSFVDALVSNLVAIQGIGNIGWEVNYPSDVKGEPWYRSKLDLAIGYIKHETRLNKYWEPQALFEMPIEVKKLPVDDKGDFTVESEMYIWQDIFKLYGYKFVDNSGNGFLKERVGKEKIMLCFSEVSNQADSLKKFQESVKERFVKKIRLKEKQSFNSGWLSEKAFTKIEQENESGEKNDFDLDYLLEKFLGWTNKTDRDFITKNCRLNLETEIIKKNDGCIFLTYQGSEKTLVATIFRLS